MKTYISGKISGLPSEEAKKKFKQAESYLQGLGHDVVNPFELRLGVDAPWESHMLFDLKLLFECDSIYMLDNWIESKGAMIEKHIADVRGMKVLFQKKEESEKYLAITIFKIKGAIQEVMGLKFEEYTTEVRCRDSFFARMIFTYHCRKTGMKLKEIARYIHRDHTTMLHYLNKYDDEVKYNPTFRAIAIRINKILKQPISQ